VLQLANSAFTLIYCVAPGQTIVSGASLAHLTGELEYFSDDVVRRALRLLASKRPFFVIAGAPEDSLRREISCDPVPKSCLRFGAHCAVVVSGGYQGTPAIFRVGSCDEARGEVLRQANGLKLATSASYFQGLVPQLLLQFTSPSGLQVSIETAVPGRAVPFSWKCLDVVMDLCLASESTNLRARPYLAEDLAQVCDAFPAHRDSLSAFADALLDWHAASRWLGHIVHGDLWLGNVLFSGNSITGIIDWEWAHQDGFLFADALQLLLMSYSVYRGVGIAKTLRSVWTGAIEEHELNARLNLIRGRFGFDRRDLKFAALVLWFNYLHERVIRGRMPSASYTEDMLPRTIPSIKAWLSPDERGTREAARSRTG
jgi:hypothetical protein